MRPSSASSGPSASPSIPASGISSSCSRRCRIRRRASRTRPARVPCRRFAGSGRPGSCPREPLRRSSGRRSALPSREKRGPSSSRLPSPARTTARKQIDRRDQRAVGGTHTSARLFRWSYSSLLSAHQTRPGDIRCGDPFALDTDASVARISAVAELDWPLVRRSGCWRISPCGFPSRRPWLHSARSARASRRSDRRC